MKLRDKNLKILKSNHVYSEEMEHDACGVGLVASTEGIKSRKVVEYGIDALKAVWHRGAIDADGKTGDGAGIHIEIPKDFFEEKIEVTGHKHDNSELCVGMIFLPRNDYSAQEQCRTIVESELTKRNFSIYGWRQVPVDPSVLGEKAEQTRPEITQVLFTYNDKKVINKSLEQKLYETRRVIEKEVDTLYKLTLNYGMELLVEPEAVTYARALPCGTVEQADGSYTEGCSSEEKNNGIEGSTAKYEQHACCNVGWMALDLEKSIGKYGEFDEEINPWGTINPNTWCGLDDGSGIYANDEKILDEQTLASKNEEKNYHVEKCEEVKGNFKVYNIPLIDDLQLIYANSVVMGAGQVFGTTV